MDGVWNIDIVSGVRVLRDRGAYRCGERVRSPRTVRRNVSHLRNDDTSKLQVVGDTRAVVGCPPVFDAMIDNSETKS